MENIPVSGLHVDLSFDTGRPLQMVKTYQDGLGEPGKFDSYFADIILNLMVPNFQLFQWFPIICNEVYVEAVSIPFEISQNTAVEHPASGKQFECQPATESDSNHTLQY